MLRAQIFPKSNFSREGEKDTVCRGDKDSLRRFQRIHAKNSPYFLRPRPRLIIRHSPSTKLVDFCSGRLFLPRAKLTRRNGEIMMLPFIFNKTAEHGNVPVCLIIDQSSYTCRALPSVLPEETGVDLGVWG